MAGKVGCDGLGVSPSGIPDITNPNETLTQTISVTVS